jgi:hypothetical protein
MNSNMPKDSSFDKTLSVLKEGYEFVMNRDKELDTNIFETRILGEKTSVSQAVNRLNCFTTPPASDAVMLLPPEYKRRSSAKAASRVSTVMRTKTVKRCSCL